MGYLKSIPLWSLAVFLLLWIPNSHCGSSQKASIKLLKPTPKAAESKIAIATRRQQSSLSGEDEENISGQRPSFAPFPEGFTQGGPRPYRFTEQPDPPSDRYGVQDAPGSSESGGMGFMPEFGPPKGFPSLSKLTDGEFPKMDSPSSSSNFGNTPEYSSYPQQGGPSKYRHFPSHSAHGGPHYYDESDDGPYDGPYGGGPVVTTSVPSQNAPKRKPHRSARPQYQGGRPSGFGGPGGHYNSYGAGSPDGAGAGPYSGGPGFDGPSRPFGSSSRRQNPFGSDGPSSRPFGSNGPSRPGSFDSDSSPFGSDGPSGNFFDSSDGPSRPYFGSSPDGPSRPHFGSHSEGRPSRPHFGSSSDGPPSRPLFGSSSDGPPSRPHFGSSSDGPPSRPLFGSSSDGPSRPLFGASSSGGHSSRHHGSDGSYSRPNFGSFQEGPSSGPYDGSDGPPSRPFGFEGSSSRPGFFGSDGPSRPPFGAPPRSSPYGGRNAGSSSDGPSGSHGKHEHPQSFSFSNTGGGYRLSRGYPRHHPNHIHHDDFKESADGDFGPFNGPPPPHYNYGPPGPGSRHQPNYKPVDNYERGPYSSEGPRSRRPDYSSHQNLGSPFASSHRQDSYNRPVVLKVSGLQTKLTRELPPGPPVFYAPSPDMKSKDTSPTFQGSKYKQGNTEEEFPIGKSSHLVKRRVKRDLEGNDQSTTTSKTSSCKSSKAHGCSPSSRVARAGTATDGKKSQAKINLPQNKGVVRRTNSTRSMVSDDMLADGTQQTAFWDVTAPFAVYNPYKKQDTGINDHDRHDEYDEEEDESIVPPSGPARSTRKNQTYYDTTSDEQRFFPSFPAPPSPYLSPFASSAGFGRPPLFPGPTANRAPSRFHPQFGPKYTAPLPNRGPSSAYPAESHDRYLHTNLLGSGNFEVVRGGTYYGDDDDGYHSTGGGGQGHYHQEDDDGYFHHNGHSSPHGYRGNPSAGGGGGDFFANFRDFADINPPTRSFSHHHETVADAEPHGSASHEQPKNILDKLESSSDNVEVHQAYSSSSSLRDSDPMMATF